MTAANDHSTACLVADPERLRALSDYAGPALSAEEAFDDLARLAAQICGTPTALVSFVEADQQWFKGRVGFPHASTGMESSVCAHALSEPDLLVIPNLAV